MVGKIELTNENSGGLVVHQWPFGKLEKFVDKLSGE